MSWFADPEIWLPVAFAALMGLAIMIYVVLDGYDLGIGLLMPLVSDAEKDRMIASIGPFWDANETWLVLAVGLLLVAFPLAHGVILTALYLPVAVMLIGLIIRGVSFEFRVKAPAGHKRSWNTAFFAGSLMTASSQGYMLGLYVMGLEHTWLNTGFALLCAALLMIGYSLIGATWLIYKTDADLQRKAVAWARRGVWGVAVAIATISAVTPLASPRIWDKWFTLPQLIFLAPLPILSAVLLIALAMVLRRMPMADDRLAWSPFALVSGLVVLAFIGLAYSFYPYVVPERMTLYEAAAAPGSLAIMLVGAVVVVPVIIGYSVLSYWVFRGKATDLRYD
ncbi:cytochrome d ubiquinol oxidase subunit II [Hyphomonadaceae bacterium BL14]|nr:cytochrome d ubiquinol oxidase subunit II [Hyphomonadaceae bacterium BL14]